MSTTGRSAATPRTPTDQGGPVVTVCAGPRCAALWLRHSDPGTELFEVPGLGAIREAVRTSRGGVLIRTACVGRCHDGPLVATGHRAGGAASTTGLRWIGGADTTDTADVLTAWVAAGGGTSPATPGTSARARRHLDHRD